MAVKEIRKLGDPVLREKCKEVSRIDFSIRRLVKDLADTMYAAPGLGLAAPQIGVVQRVLVADVGEGLITMINPRLLKAEGTVVEEEGCLSLYEIKCPVPRAQSILVQAYDLQGRKFQLPAEGLLARVIQHEADHLDGILFIDRASPADRRQVLMAINEMEMARESGEGL